MYFIYGPKRFYRIIRYMIWAIITFCCIGLFYFFPSAKPLNALSFSGVAKRLSFLGFDRQWHPYGVGASYGIQDQNRSYRFSQPWATFEAISQKNQFNLKACCGAYDHDKKVLKMWGFVQIFGPYHSQMNTSAALVYLNEKMIKSFSPTWCKGDVFSFQSCGGFEVTHKLIKLKGKSCMIVHAS